MGVLLACMSVHVVSSEARRRRPIPWDWELQVFVILVVDAGN